MEKVTSFPITWARTFGSNANHKWKCSGWQSCTKFCELGTESVQRLVDTQNLMWTVGKQQSSSSSSRFGPPQHYWKVSEKTCWAGQWWVLHLFFLLRLPSFRYLNYLFSERLQGYWSLSQMSMGEFGTPGQVASPLQGWHTETNNYSHPHSHLWAI